MGEPVIRHPPAEVREVLRGRAAAVPEEEADPVEALGPAVVVDQVEVVVLAELDLAHLLPTRSPSLDNLEAQLTSHQ